MPYPDAVEGGVIMRDSNDNPSGKTYEDKTLWWLILPRSFPR